MEELRRLSIQYYQNTVGLKFFGLRGGWYIFLSTPFLALSFYLNFTLHADNLMIVPILIGGVFWRFARKEYDRNLIRHLSYFSHLDSKNVNEHKALYLSELTSHVSSSLFDAMKVFKEIVDTNNKNRSFVLDNIGYHFSKFLYDPDSKNRILSLVIYLISLVALLTVIKPEPKYDIYELIQSVSMQDIRDYFVFWGFMILLGYFLIVIPLMFIITFVVVPGLLKFSSLTVLSRFFISELNKYAYLEQRLQLTKTSS